MLVILLDRNSIESTESVQGSVVLKLWEFKSSLGVAIGRATLAGPRTGSSEPFRRGPVLGGPRRIAFTVPMS